MCFFGFLRAGEVVIPGDGAFDPAVHLAYGNVRVSDHQDPQFIEVHIKASKTDPYRRGVKIYLGKASGELCPVAAVLGYMICRGDRLGPFFTFSDGRYLTRERFVEAVQKALARAGYTSRYYAGHSFRIGAATTAAREGIQDSLIYSLHQDPARGPLWSGQAIVLPLSEGCQVLVVSTWEGTNAGGGGGGGGGGKQTSTMHKDTHPKGWVRVASTAANPWPEGVWPHSLTQSTEETLTTAS